MKLVYCVAFSNKHKYKQTDSYMNINDYIKQTRIILELNDRLKGEEDTLH